jgi:UDP-N-acetylglucosamine 4,6-dehydratase
MFKNKTIFISGGTGSFGLNFSKYIIENYNFKKIIIYSRDELKQFEMQNSVPFKNNKKLRFFIGDIRDLERLNTALRDVDIVIHAAALKQVSSSEYNPFEAVKTNIIGSQNIITASINQNVKQVIALSTDKACSPLNLYGATKLCAEKLFVNANSIAGKKNIKFSVLRYGNVNGSRGSVMPLFLKKKQNNERIFITDKRMTRFSIKMNSAINMVLWGLKNFYGGEILVPILPSYRVVDLAKALNMKYEICGIRQGEKIHEDLISFSESMNLFKIKNYYLILKDKQKNLMTYYKKKGGKIVIDNFQYNSYSNKDFLSIETLRSILMNLDD